MTREEREEAIRCLSVHSSTNGSGLCTDEQHYKAKQMAIQALSQEPKTQMIDKSNFDIEQYKMDLQGAYDCGFEAGKRLEQEPCDDAISRQAAQAKIKSICDEYRLSYEDGERKAATGGSAYALGHAFDDLPPVTQKPGHYIDGVHAMGYREGYKDAQKQKSGKWKYVPDADGFYICSECSCGNDYADNFCPNCGAKMESEDKE